MSSSALVLWEPLDNFFGVKTTRKCRGCDNEFPLTREFFGFKRNRANKFGEQRTYFHLECRKCMATLKSKNRTKTVLRKRLRGDLVQARAVTILALQDPHIMNMIYRGNPEGFRRALQEARAQVFEECLTYSRRHCHATLFDPEDIYVEVAQEYKIPFKRKVKT